MFYFLLTLILYFVCEFGGEGMRRFGKKRNEHVKEIEENGKEGFWVNFSL